MTAWDGPGTARGLALLERATGYTRGCLGLVTPGALGRATPCRGWDLAALLAHMRDSLDALCEAADVGAVGLDAAPPCGDETPGASPEDPVEALRLRACRLLGAWTRPDRADVVAVGGSPLASDLLAGAGALEVAVHGWDVAAACGAPRPLPDCLATELLALVPRVVAPEDRPVRFAPPVPVPPGTPAGARLVALLGRHPVGVVAPGGAASPGGVWPEPRDG
jgi:uncharacterized protein (TIGR03086 family)